jgi:hypothetical protein
MPGEGELEVLARGRTGGDRWPVGLDRIDHGGAAGDGAGGGQAACRGRQLECERPAFRHGEGAAVEPIRTGAERERRAVEAGAQSGAGRVGAGGCQGRHRDRVSDGCLEAGSGLFHPQMGLGRTGGGATSVQPPARGGARRESSIGIHRAEEESLQAEIARPGNLAFKSAAVPET